MAKVISVTKFSKLILENPGIFKLREGVPMEQKALAKYLRKYCETYGNETYCYLPLLDSETRVSVESWLYVNDYAVDRSWGKSIPPTAAISLRVSYIKAFGWDK